MIAMQTTFRAVALCLALFAVSGQSAAQDRMFDLAAPDALVETGFLKFLIPRFSLKNATRVRLVPAGAVAQAYLLAKSGAGAVPVFAEASRNWYLSVDAGNEHANRFADWLLSDIGQQTVAGFTVEGQPKFVGIADQAIVADAAAMDGNAARGLVLSRAKCGRCHVVDTENLMRGIGSTPSFPVLRALPDWEQRFAGFFLLNPHPSFTQVNGVTEPFAAHLPPAIFPIFTTQDEVDDILAYVTGLLPADLGAPLQHQ